MNRALPKNYYDVKKLVSKLGLTSRRIDCCIQGCMLFYDSEYGKTDDSLIRCKFCDMPRYRDHNIGGNTKKLVLIKDNVLFTYNSKVAEIVCINGNCWSHVLAPWK